jgi:hypothetical protein
VLIFKLSKYKFNLKKIYLYYKFKNMDNYNSLKVYQIKDIIEQYNQQNETNKVKVYKSKPKTFLLEILRKLKIDLSKYDILENSPNKAIPANILKKYGTTQYNEKDQKLYEEELQKNERYKNPFISPNINISTKAQEHQKKFIRQFILSNIQGSVVFHGVGSGKTLSAVIASYYYLKLYPENKVIVISPPALLYNFVEGLIQYGVDIKDNRYNFLTYEKYIRKPIIAKNSLLIIDEAQNFRTEIKIRKQIDPNDSENVLEEVVSNKRAEKVMKYGTDHAHKCLALTGTPFVNNLYDIENLLAMTEKRRPIDSKSYEIMIGSKANYPDYFNYRISFYRNSKDSEEFFPKRIDKFIPLYMNERMANEYKEIESKGIPPEFKSKKNKDDEDDIANSDYPNPFFSAEAWISSQVKNDDGINPKIEYILKQILSKPNEKFIIYATLYTASIVNLKNYLIQNDINPVLITGRENATKKEESKKLFNFYNFKDENFFNKNEILPNDLKFINDKYRILIISKAGGEGVDTKNCNNIILFNQLWNDAGAEQIIARAIRFKSHFQLPKEKRYVNVFQLFLLFENSKEIFNKVINPNFKDFIKLRGDLRQINETSKDILMKTMDANLIKLKDLEELKIPEKNIDRIERRRGGIGKKYIEYKIRVFNGWEGYDKIKEKIKNVNQEIKKQKNENLKGQLKNFKENLEAELQLWIIETYNQYQPAEKKIKRLREELEIPQGNLLSIDLKQFILSKAKTENIEEFIGLFNKEILLLEKYELFFIKEVESILKQKPNEDIDSIEYDIYERFLRETDSLIIRKLNQYQLSVDEKKDRKKEAKLQQYYTHIDEIKRMIDLSEITDDTTNYDNLEFFDILEPTAGEGHIVKGLLELLPKIIDRPFKIDMIEFDKKNREILKEITKINPLSIGLYNQPNFLLCIPSKRYDFIFMNPPFNLRRAETGAKEAIFDYHFIIRAFGCLKINGNLVAIKGKGTGGEKGRREFTKFLTENNKNGILEYSSEFRKAKFTKNVNIEIELISIKKLSDNLDNEIFSIDFYPNIKAEGEDIINNTLSIDNLEENKKPETLQKADFKTPFISPFISPFKSPINIEPEIEIPAPAKAPENINPVINRIEEKVKQLQDIGDEKGAVNYRANSWIGDLSFIILIKKYKGECLVINQESKSKQKKHDLGVGITISKAKIENNIKQLGETLKECLNRKKELIIIPLTLPGHANLIIFRPLLKIVERYEPHGVGFGGDANSTVERTANRLLKNLFENDLTEYIGQVKYIPPFEICPIIKQDIKRKGTRKIGDKQYGLQSIEASLKGLKQEGGGFCMMWSLFLAEMIFTNPNIPTIEILDEVFRITDDEPLYLKKVIRGYVVLVEKEIDNLYKILDNSNFEFTQEKNFFQKNFYNKNQLLDAWVLKEMFDFQKPIQGGNLIKNKDYLKNLLNRRNINWFKSLFL